MGIVFRRKEQVMLMNFIGIYSNLLNYFIFVYLLLIEDYKQGALRNKLIIAPLVQRFKTAIFRKSYS